MLADSEELKYFDQMLISAYSARYRGFKGNIYVVLDPHTHECILKSGRKDAAELDLKLTELAVPEELNIKEISRYLKTGCRDCIAGDMLFLDTDTLIVRELPETVSTTLYLRTAAPAWQARTWTSCSPPISPQNLPVRALDWPFPEASWSVAEPVFPIPVLLSLEGLVLP